MAQRPIYREPLPLSLGGTKLKAPTGLLVGSPSTDSFRQIALLSGSVLRSNGLGWEISPGGRLIQMAISYCYTQILTQSFGSFVPTGLQGQITPKRSDSQLIVMVKQNGIGVLGAKSDWRYGEFKLLWGTTLMSLFGLPFGFAGGAGMANAGVGGASYIGLVTPGGVAPQSFSTQVTNRGSAGQIIVQWGGIASSMLIMEVCSNG